MTPDQRKAFTFLDKYTARIEVCVHDKLERVYFAVKPLCGYISVKKKTQLMLDVIRESQ